MLGQVRLKKIIILCHFRVIAIWQIFLSLLLSLPRSATLPQRGVLQADTAGGCSRPGEEGEEGHQERQRRGQERGLGKEKFSEESFRFEDIYETCLEPQRVFVFIK